MRNPLSLRAVTAPMRRLLLAGLSLVLISACGATPQIAQEPGSEKTVASYFSPPEAFPGPVWTKNGKPVDGRELNSIAGPEHCDWQSVVMMHLDWPLGTVAQNSRESRQFIRDPGGILEQGLREKLALHTTMPLDAAPTGYHLGQLQLWLSPSTPDAVYLRVGDDVERWPRAKDMIACA
jgi:hypothetical protein